MKLYILLFSPIPLFYLVPLFGIKGVVTGWGGTTGFYKGVI